MSKEVCGLCATNNNLTIYQVTPANSHITDPDVTLCKTCLDDIELTEAAPIEHWRCLNDSMWSANIAVQVLAWRQLNKLKEVSWASSLLDMLYLEEDILTVAQAGLNNSDSHQVIHKDSNGVTLLAGDSVTVLKDLPVKGSSMVAKRGTVVRRISLVHSNAEHIEGRVDGQKIVILTKFVKKS